MAEKIMVLDTETTGVPNFKLPSDAPGQPHICEFAAVLYEDMGYPYALREINTLIKPDGWTIPGEATEIHGITTEDCEQRGMPSKPILERTIRMMGDADVIAGYNLAFDLKMFRGACRRADLDYDYDEMQAKKYDVMQKCTPLCKLPPSAKMRAAGFKSYKTPTLGEAASMLLQKPIEDVHRAFADVSMTAQLYWYIHGVADVVLDASDTTTVEENNDDEAVI